MERVLKDGVTTVSYFVVFEQGNIDSFWSRWLKPGFRHVYAVRDAGDKWVVLQPRLAFLDVFIMCKHEYPHIRTITGDKPKIIEVSHAIKEAKLMGFGLLSCVEVVKSALGIKHRSTITPYQLYKGLMSGKYNG